ncbi:UDP-glucose 4-epimerase [Methanohalophilus levihalophilus]|uniref:NAD-dependent epimerase/dehydratase family protein n=1 Tax=Methanohalophilus levihalophilus TaxID=1431282 RepID=UPI001AE710AD|nr:NAD-dependent epimerase/dehydratase family protein [Methanohalophilus levihalophilus]MBP2030121.1 UDP-glucose 4-epimerase [Methanohalophilus levihalophilus]
MESILITGGLGQVGSYLTDYFEKENNVTVLDNGSFPCRETVPEGVELVWGDINDKIVSKLISNTDIIIHTAAQVSVPNSMKEPAFDATNNILGTLNLLEASRRAKIKRFIYFSSAAVYGNPVELPIGETHPQNPESPYGVSKLAGEKYAMMYHRSYGLPVVSIRPFNIYSPRQDPSNPYSGVISKFMDCAREEKAPLIFGTGEQTRDFISVHDIVRIVDLAIQKDEAVGKVLNAGSGSSTTVNELASIIRELFKSDIQPQYEEERTGDILHSVANITEASRLGFEPKMSLKEGLAEFL